MAECRPSSRGGEKCIGGGKAFVDCFGALVRELSGVTFFGSIATAVVLAGCGGSAALPAGLQVAPDNNCGSAYALTSPTARAATICLGTVGYPPVRVALHQRERFVVTSAGKPEFGVLIPRGGTIRLTSARGSAASYVATRAGQAELISKSHACQKPVDGECVAFVLVVS